MITVSFVVALGNDRVTIVGLAGDPAAKFRRGPPSGKLFGILELERVCETGGGRRVKVRARASLTVLVATAAVVCTACGSSASLGAGTGHRGGSHSTGKTVTIVGTVMRVGGAAGPPPAQPTPVPLDADVAAYRKTAGQATYSGSPVAQTQASASSGGRFELQVPPGSYFVVAQRSAWAPAVVTVTASADQKQVSVTLDWAVP